MNRRRFLGTLGALAVVRAQAAPASALFRPAWEAYRRRFVRPDGAVVDDYHGIVHSESQGVTMLLAVHAADREVFDALWRFTRTRLRRDDGLHSWAWKDGRVQDTNNAADGDLYIAWALLRAAHRFEAPELRRQALSVAAAIDRHLVTDSKHGLLLKPAIRGFDFPDRPPIINPSYFVFPALRELGAAAPATRLLPVADSGLALLSHARFGIAELPADWLELSDPVRPYAPMSRRFGYDAMRVPLFLAWDRQGTHPALAAFVRLTHAGPLPAWVDLLDGQRAPFAAPPGAQAIAALARAVHLNTAVSARCPADDNYYSSSLCLLSLMAAEELGLRWA